MKDLTIRFMEGAKTLATTEAWSTSSWRSMEEAYSAPGRYYHNLQHLQNLFQLFDQYEDKLQEPTVVIWAIWYHDFVYDARRKDNELRSAQLARTQLQKTTLPPDKIERVVRFIEATAQHLSVKATGDLAYFLDFDLAILGSDRVTYEAYARAVRKEYQYVPGFLYRRGRCKVLRYFLDAPVLFRTPELQERFAEQARKNIQWELSKKAKLY